MKFNHTNVRASKLTPEQVLEIRELYHNQRYTQRRLGNLYGVSTETIGRIVRGDTWKSYGGPGDHPGAEEQTVAQRLHEFAVEQQVKAAPAVMTQAEADSLAILRKRLQAEGLYNPLVEDPPQSEEQSDEHASDSVQGQAGTVLPSVDRGGSAGTVPAGDLPLDKPGEEG